MKRSRAGFLRWVLYVIAAIVAILGVVLVLKSRSDMPLETLKARRGGVHGGQASRRRSLRAKRTKEPRLARKRRQESGDFQSIVR